MKKFGFQCSMFIIIIVAVLGLRVYAIDQSGVNENSNISNFKQLVPQDITTYDQLNQYVQQVKSNNTIINLSDSAQHKLSATITFSQYLSIDELTEFIEDTNISLHQIQLRGIMDDGTRVTFATLVSKGIDYTTALIYEQSQLLDVELVGVTDIYAYINADQIEALERNNLTYLVDTSGNSNMFAQSSLPTDQNTVSISEFPKSIAWELENLNILTQ